MTRMPLESKTKVFTSASAPSAGISWPFQRKVTPAALPILATISRVARTEAWAGAMSVSWLTVWPSARTEIQEVSVARITKVRGAVGFAEGGGFFARGRTVTSLLSSASAGGGGGGRGRGGGVGGGGNWEGRGRRGPRGGGGAGKGGPISGAGGGGGG